MVAFLRNEAQKRSCARLMQVGLCVLVVLLLPFGAAGCASEPRYKPVGEQLDTPEIEGTNVYIGQSDVASGVVVVVDGRVFLLRRGEDGGEAGIYVENDERIVGRPMWVPFVVDNEDSYQVWYYATGVTHPLVAYQRAPGDTESVWGPAVADAFDTVVWRGRPLTPIMFPEQYYRFQDGEDWFELTVSATPKEGDIYRYRFEVAYLPEKPETVMGAPGYDVLDIGNQRSLWLFRDWEAPETISEWVNVCVAQLEQFFGVNTQLVPLHMIIGPPGLNAEHVVYLGGRAFMQYAAATVNRYFPAARCTTDPTSGLCVLTKHELTHVVHNWALLQQGYIPDDVPWWLKEGLATFLASSYDYQAYARKLAATHHVTPIEPDDVGSLLNPTTNNPSYDLATTMVGYLVDEFGADVVADYAVQCAACEASEDDMMQQHFGLDRHELLAGLLTSYETSPGPPLDYVIDDWELLGGPELDNRGFTISPEGTKAAVLCNLSTEICLLDLETRETRTILPSAPELNGMGPISWFPDGQHVALVARPDGIANIYSMDIDNPDTMEPLVASDTSDSGPDVAPDGRYLAFRSERTGHSELYILDLSTGQLEQLTAEESYLVWPSWSPDGSRLACVDSHREKLGVVDLTTRDIEWLDPYPYGIFSASRPRWLSNERLILNVSDSDYHVVALDFNLAQDTMGLWGAMDMWPYFEYFDVIPGPVAPRFLVQARVYSDGRLYRGLLQVEFEEAK